MRIRCFDCGNSVSTEVDDDTVFRAVAHCPECVQKQPDYERQIDDLRAKLVRVMVERDELAGWKERAIEQIGVAYEEHIRVVEERDAAKAAGEAVGERRMWERTCPVCEHYIGGYCALSHGTRDDRVDFATCPLRHLTPEAALREALGDVDKVAATSETPPNTA